MIDSGRIARLLAASALLTALLAAGAGFYWKSAALAGGIGVGLVLGAAPFASWAWIASRVMRGVRTRAMAIFLIVSKLGLYSLTLWLTVSKNLVDPVGIFVGLSAVVFVLIGGSLLAPPAPGEAA